MKFDKSDINVMLHLLRTLKDNGVDIPEIKWIDKDEFEGYIEHNELMLAIVKLMDIIENK